MFCGPKLCCCLSQRLPIAAIAAVALSARMGNLTLAWEFTTGCGRGLAPGDACGLCMLSVLQAFLHGRRPDAAGTVHWADCSGHV